MELQDKDYTALRNIAEHEKTMDDQKKEIGWTWRDVMVYPGTINKLLLAELVKCTYRSNKYTCYMLTDKGREVAESGVKLVQPKTGETPIQLKPEKLFTEIVGYDNVKELLREALVLEDPIHVLLYGPPSIAKSMFLIDIEDGAKGLSLPLLGSATSHAGMWDLIVERRPKYLLIDEIEKMSLQDMAGLLSLMEHQRIVRAKVGRRLEERVDCRVFAAANRISRLPPELLSRFWKCQLEEYGAGEYVRVVESVLVRREGMCEEDAHLVAMKLMGKTHDVRDAIRVARLAKRTGAEKALQLWKG